MENVIEVLRVLERIAERIFRDGSIDAVEAVRAIMFRISLAARLAIAWPFVLLLVAMCGYGFAQWTVPIITILALLVFLWMLTEPGPLGLLLAQAALAEKPPSGPSTSGTEISILEKFVAKTHEAMRAIRLALGVEILTGIYFSFVPIANDRRLALIMVLIVAAIICFVGRKTKISKVVVAILFLAACAITLMFYLRGTASPDSKGTSIQPFLINFNIDRRVEAKADEQSQKPPAEQPTGKKDSGDPAGSPVGQPAPPALPAPTPTEVEILPISGIDGNLITPLTGCGYLHAGEIVCGGYILNQGDLTQPVRLCDSSGEYRIGRQAVGFSVWLSDGSISFKGGGNVKQLSKNEQLSFEIKFAAPSGVKSVNLHLQMADGHGNSWEAVFINVPVSSNYQ
jgi:hypothetical protein